MAIPPSLSTIRTILHPSDFTSASEVAFCHARVRQGPVVEEIVAAAREISADLIVMTTDGHHGFLDALRGNTTERVLHAAHCALLAVPAPA